MKHIPSLLRRLTLVALFVVCLALFCSCDDFKIDNGVLEKYRGEDEVVVIPEGVTTIEYDAFYDKGSGVKEIHFPISLETINPTTIAYLSADVTFHFSEYHPIFYTDNGNIMRRETKTLVLAARDGKAPSYAEGIEERAYSSVRTDADIILPEGITTIPAGAFSNCHAKSVTITSVITEIAANAFADADMGTVNITILSPLTEGALSNMEASRVVIDAPAIETKAIAKSEITEIVIGMNTVEIEESALYKTKVKRLTLPFLGTKASVTRDVHIGIIFGDPGTSIGFGKDSYGNRVPKKLEQVTVLSGEVGYDAFSGCDGLHTVYLVGVHGYIGKNAFADGEKKFTLYVGPLVEGFEPGALTRTDGSRTIKLYYAGTAEQWDALDKQESGSGWNKVTWSGGATINMLYEQDIPD